MSSTIHIHVSGARFAPSWQALQTLVATMGHERDEFARLERGEARTESADFVRIRRTDGGSDYQAPGDYEVLLRDGTQVSLTVD